MPQIKKGEETMGFFKKIIEFFRGKKEEPIEAYSAPMPQETITTSQYKEIKVKKPGYKKVQRTKETDQYVQQMLKKATSPDKKVTPYN